MAPKPPTQKRAPVHKPHGKKSSSSSGDGLGPKASKSASLAKATSRRASDPLKSSQSKSAAHRKSTTHNVGTGVTKAVPAYKKHRKPLNEHQLAELEKTLPVLNTVVPVPSAQRNGIAGKAGGRGKKGKIFVGDHEKEKLLRMVEKAAMGVEGEVESKLEKAVSFSSKGLLGLENYLGRCGLLTDTQRRLEAIREARRKEEDEKRQRREELKKEKKGKKAQAKEAKAEDAKKGDRPNPMGIPKKRVQFA